MQTIEQIIEQAVARGVKAALSEFRPPEPEGNGKHTCTVAEWAVTVGVSKPRAYDMTHIEGFPVVVIGRRRVVLVDAAKRWLNERAQEGTAI